MGKTSSSKRAGRRPGWHFPWGIRIRAFVHTLARLPRCFMWWRYPAPISWLTILFQSCHPKEVDQTLRTQSASISTNTFLNCSGDRERLRHRQNFECPNVVGAGSPTFDPPRSTAAGIFTGVHQGLHEVFVRLGTLWYHVYRHREVGIKYAESKQSPWAKTLWRGEPPQALASSSRTPAFIPSENQRTTESIYRGVRLTES